MAAARIIRRKLIATAIISVIMSVGAIIHGVFLDLNVAQLERLSLEALLVTFAAVFCLLLVLEWIFDLENTNEFKQLGQRVRKLERAAKGQ